RRSGNSRVQNSEHHTPFIPRPAVAPTPGPHSGRVTEVSSSITAAPRTLPAATAHPGTVTPIGTTVERRRVRRTDLYEGTSWLILAAVPDAVMIWSAALTAVPLTTPQPNTLELILLGVFGFAAMARLATRGLYGARPARMSVLDTIRHSSASVLMA